MSRMLDSPSQEFYYTPPIFVRARNSCIGAIWGGYVIIKSLPMKKHIRPNRLLIYLALAWLFLGSLYYLSHKTLAPIAQSAPQSPISGDFLVIDQPELVAQTPIIDPKTAYNEAFEVWLDKLESYENCPSQGIIDSNSLRSYGPLCFQRATYLGYMRIFGSQVMPYAEEGEWLNNLSDRRTQRDLAKLIIEADHSAWRNWWTSIKVRKMGEPPRLPQ